MKTLNQKGFTMIEMVISTFVSTIITASIFIAIQVSHNQMNTSDIAMAIDASGREGLYRMVQEIRESAPTKIAIAADGGTITFNVPDPSSPVTSGYAVSWPGHSIQYTRGGTNNSQIIRTNVSTGQTSVIANDVTSITFTGDAASPTAVTVAMGLQRALINGRNIPATPLTLTSQAKIRNT